MPRKPGSTFNTSVNVANIRDKKDVGRLRNVADVRHINDAYQMRMNYNTGHIGIDGADGQAYPQITQKGLKELFLSDYVPMTDGNKVLIEPDKKPMSQRGYGNVPNRKPPKVPKGNRPGITHQDVAVIKHQNNAVFTDFPKGAGRTDTQIVWRDGTYDEAVLSATKQLRGEVADQTFADILRSNPRMAEMALASQVGAVQFGDAMARKEIEDYFNAEKKEFDKNVLIQLGFTDAEAEARINAVNRERMISDIAKRLGLSEKASRNVLDLVIPEEYRQDATSRMRAEGERLSATEELERRYAEARRERGLPAEAGYRATASNVFGGADELEADYEAERRGRESEERRIARNRLRQLANPNAEAIRNEIQARLRKRQLATQTQPSSEREANRFATETQPFMEASRRSAEVLRRIEADRRQREEAMEAYRRLTEPNRLRLEARERDNQRRNATLAYYDRQKKKGRK